jgi:hypothetical protein
MDFIPIERWNKRFIEDALRKQLGDMTKALENIYNQHEHIDNEYAQGAAKMASEALKRLEA